ncbi:hypothetical protein [Altericroceibacterium xinjiangense]|uniref:hypothetical protein n=1 Tax=Altericroceibacterium xinjiangense TaxID=762261 RepID=UPI000F7F3483|nr:hypothetical protein [Altericroceibacterium xinjiangense]
MTRAAKLTLIVVACGTVLGAIGGQFTNPTPKPPPDQPWLERHLGGGSADYVAAEPVPQYAPPVPPEPTGVPAWVDDVAEDWPTASLDRPVEYPDIAYAEPAYTPDVEPRGYSDVPAYRPPPPPRADGPERAGREFDRPFERPPEPRAAPRPELDDPWAPSDVPPPAASPLPRTPDGSLPAIW